MERGGGDYSEDLGRGYPSNIGIDMCFHGRLIRAKKCIRYIYVFGCNGPFVSRLNHSGPTGFHRPESPYHPTGGFMGRKFTALAQDTII